MYYGGSRSSSSYSDSRNFNGYGKNHSYSYSSDLSLISPRNPAIQRVINSEYGRPDRSLSPSRDYNSMSRVTAFRSLSPSLTGDKSPTVRRRDVNQSDRSSPAIFGNDDLNYAVKSRNYYDFPSTSTMMFTSYSSTIKKPRRTDYTDYLRPVLTARPVLKSGYVPRSRAERDSVSTDIVRERKLIKFREMSDEVLEKIRRKISWDLPEEISSPLIDEMKKQLDDTSDDKHVPEGTSSRRGSKDTYTPSMSPISGSPRQSLSRRSSGDQSLDRPIRPPMRRHSRTNSLIASSIKIIQEHIDSTSEDMSLPSKAPKPPPRKKSLGSIHKGRKSRKSSVDILLSEEKTQNYSKIADDIRRGREIAESIKKLADGSEKGNQQSSQPDETEVSAAAITSHDTRETTDVVPDRSRRRRKTIQIPEPGPTEEKPPETRRRRRSQFASHDSNESVSPFSNSTCPSVEKVDNETPRAASRMHRKSVKYKSDGLPPRRSSKGTDIFPDSVIPSIQSMSSNELKSNQLIPEVKRDSLIKSDLKKIGKVSNSLSNQKINIESKHEIEDKLRNTQIGETTTKPMHEQREKSLMPIAKENESRLEKNNKRDNIKNERIEVTKIMHSHEKKSSDLKNASDKPPKTEKETEGKKLLGKAFKTDSMTPDGSILDKAKADTRESKINFENKICENDIKTVAVKDSVVKTATKAQAKSSDEISLNKASESKSESLTSKSPSSNKSSKAENKETDKKLNLDKMLKIDLKDGSKNSFSNTMPKIENKEANSRIAEKSEKDHSKIMDKKSILTDKTTKCETEETNKKTLEKKERNLSQTAGKEETVNVRIKDSSFGCKTSEILAQKPQTEPDRNSKLKPQIPDAKENEEIVIVCKLPKKPELERKISIPNEQSVVVSIKNTAIRTVESVASSSKPIKSVESNNSIIPSTHCKDSKLRICDAQKVHSADESDVNVTHTIVLKNKAQSKSEDTKTSNLNVESDGARLKQIPDVIKSTVNIRSKVTADISDVVKSTLSKTEDQTKLKKSLLPDIKGNSTDWCNKKSVNDISKSEEPAYISETVTKGNDKSHLKQNEAESNLIASKEPKTNKNLINVAKSKSSVFSDSKVAPNSLSIKKSSSDILNDSKEALNQKPFVKPDLIQMTTKEAKIENKSLPSITKDTSISKTDTSEKKNTFQNYTLEPCKYDENRTREFKSKMDINGEYSPISNISKKDAFSSDNYKSETSSKTTEQNKMLNKSELEAKSTVDKISDIKTRADRSQTLPVSKNKTEQSLESKDAASSKTLETKENNQKFINKNILPEIQNKDIKGDKLSKNMAFFNNEDTKKHITSVYKKSTTAPNIKTLLEEPNASNDKAIAQSDVLKNKKSEHSSLSTGDVPTKLQEKKPLSHKDTTAEGVDILKTKNDNSTAKKIFHLPKVNSNEVTLPKDLKASKDSKITECNKSTVIKISETDKMCSEKQIKENSAHDGIKSFKHDKNKPEADKLSNIKTECEKNIEKTKSTPLPETKEKVKKSISSGKENNQSTEHFQETSVSIDKHSDIKNTMPMISKVTQVEKNEKKPSDILKLPAVQDAAKCPVSLKPNEANTSPQIRNEKLDVTKISRVGSIIRKDKSQMSNLIVDGKCRNDSENQDFTTTKKPLSEEKLNSEQRSTSDSNLKISKETENSINDDEKGGVQQKTNTKELEKSKPSKAKQPKLPPVPPQYHRFGLFIRPKEPQRTILESSSSDEGSDTETETESESSSEEETPNINESSRIANGKCPDRGEKTRSHSETSNTSVTSNSSVSTTYSSLSAAFDEVGSPKRSDKSLKFRKYGIEDFVFLKLLGKGSFGKVLLAELKDCNMYFAIKCLKKDVVLEDDDVESTMIERRVLALGTQHPYMCKLYCTFQTKNYLFFVMEYLNGGDLMFHIQENGRFEERRAMFYGAEIVSALKFLHRRGIVYRDIKLDNIILDEDGHVHLVDFGMCKSGIFDRKRTATFCGTPDYIPPEIVLGQKYNQSVDWWSFGVLLYEMLIGKSPFHGTDEDELFWSICNEDPYFPRFLSTEATHILHLLLKKAPSERLGMPSCPAGEIKEHAFFSTINWESVENKQIPPIFKPSVSGPCDTSNFDSSFTTDSATLSPIDTDVLKSMDQEQFNGFTYTNPHLTE